jgi:hypothetical protein
MSKKRAIFIVFYQAWIPTVSYNPMFTESRKKNDRSLFLLTPIAALYIVSHYENSGVHQTGM